MLIHACIECGDLSINRIAADDDPESILDVFYASKSMSRYIRSQCEIQGITMIQNEENVYMQLHGYKLTVSVFD